MYQVSYSSAADQNWKYVGQVTGDTSFLWYVPPEWGSDYLVRVETEATSPAKGGIFTQRTEIESDVSDSTFTIGAFGLQVTGLEFGYVKVGDTVAMTIDVGNHGNIPGYVDSVKLLGGHAGFFSFTEPFVPRIMNPSELEQMVVRFIPEDSGRYNGLVRAYANGDSVENQVVGTGQRGHIAAVTDSHLLPSVPPGAVVDTTLLCGRNVDNVPLRIDSLRIKGSNPEHDVLFSIRDFIEQLSAGQPLEIPVRFEAPPTDGVYATSLVLIDQYERRYIWRVSAGVGDSTLSVVRTGLSPENECQLITKGGNSIIIRRTSQVTAMPEYSVYDVSGREVMRGSFQSGKSEMRLDVSHLPRGHYFFRANSYVSDCSGGFIRK